MWTKLVELAKKYQNHRQITMTIKELNSLTDRELRDIGIHRSIIREVAMGTISADQVHI